MNAKHINKAINIIATGNSINELPENQRKKLVNNLYEIRDSSQSPERKYQQISNLLKQSVLDL